MGTLTLRATYEPSSKYISMIKTAIGHSEDPDSLAAIQEVVAQCHQTLTDQRPQAGILFAGIDFDHELILQRIHQAFPDIALIGGTTDGEISSQLGFQQDSVTLMLLCSDRIEFSAGIGTDLSHDPQRAVQHAVKHAQAPLSKMARLCLTTPESLTIAPQTIVKHLQEVLGPHIPIFGGATGDQWRYQQTYQFCGTHVFSDAVPILLLAGEFCFSYGAVSGWTPISQAGIVTKSHGPVVYEIDGQPALDFYRRYLGNLSPTPEYPLAVFAPEGNDFWLQGCVAYDLEVGSATFFAHIPEQAIVKLTKASCDEILAASRVSFMNALESYPGTMPEVALFFSCGARRYLLGTRTQEEHQLIHTCLPHPIPYIGIYSYGEIAPAGYNSTSRIHNMTFVTLLLGSESNSSDHSENSFFDD